MKLELLEACNRIIHTLNLDYLAYHRIMAEFDKLIKNNKLSKRIVEIDNEYYDEHLDGEED